MSGSLLELTLYEKRRAITVVQRRQASRLVELYSAGQLKLDRLITREYTLEQINEGL